MLNCAGVFQGNTAVEVSLAKDKPEASTSLASPTAPSTSTDTGLPQIVQRKWCGHYAISSDTFDDSTVGAKSLNTVKLRVSRLTCGLE